MRKILRPLFVTLLIASCGGGAGTNPFDSREQTTSEATGGGSANQTDTSDGNTDNANSSNGNTNESISNGNTTNAGSTGTNSSGGSIPSTTLDGTTPTDGTAVTGEQTENFAVIRTTGAIGDTRYTIEDGKELSYIDNLGFDETAAGSYEKVINFGGYGTQDIYAAPVTVIDAQNNQPITQNGAYAVFGTSESGSTSYVVVHHLLISEPLKGHRYQRERFDKDDNVVLFKPLEDGQLSMTGQYLGMRTRSGNFDGEYVIADLNFDIDLQDPNDSRAIQLFMSNRTRYSMADGLSLEGKPGYAEGLPYIGWIVLEGGLDANGEFSMDITSQINGQAFESGSVNGILVTNQDGLVSEGAGVIELESQDPTQFANQQNGSYSGAVDKFIEAGGFILDRNLP